MAIKVAFHNWAVSAKNSMVNKGLLIQAGNGVRIGFPHHLCPLPPPWIFKKLLILIYSTSISW